MSGLSCEKCGRQFTRNASLTYHITNKVCMRDNENDDSTSKYTCKVCLRKFTTASAMYRHVNHTCKIKKKNEEQKKEIYEGLVKTEFEKMEKKIKDLSDEITKLKAAKNHITTKNHSKNVINGSVNNGTVNNGTVNNTNNIILVGYGKEDISKLNKSDLLKILQTGYNSTIKLTEAVHFNPNFPEYHNVYISNMKDKYAMMFDGKKWTLTVKEALINQIYEDKKNYIEENLEEFVESLPASRKKALERWLNTDDEDQKIKEIKENIKLLLYNSRQLVCDSNPQQNLAVVKKGDEPVPRSKSRKIPKHVVIDDDM